MSRLVLRFVPAVALLTPSSALAGALDFSVTGALMVRPGQGVAYQGVAQLTVGWEQLLLGRSATARAEASSLAEPGEPSSLPEDGATPEAPAPAAPSKPEPSRQLEQPWLRPVFALELMRAVMQRGVGRAAELDSLATRSRTRALLPEVRLRAGRGTDQTLRYSPTVDDPDRWLVSGAADYNYEAQASWSFDRLVFADDEVAIERLRQQEARARGERALRALKLLFNWQRAWVRLRFGALEPEEFWTAELDLLQARSELDVLSAGWFSERLTALGAE